ncbi:nitroreductase [Frondihabitans sucicola]|uniref:Nitroreductase n=1 Tax=Frondihabitans sucicola TaxID=1268041 RepID=A0ABM8GK55_9MICO|nr:nitroreductase family deazaflavin-dependent oxidoreductase [Frondihabitans sucicola]BDZ48747.1 nitroreductase [Frondihabitans sucicola]
MATAEKLHGPEHVARYLETDGEDGYEWREGTTILLLTTTGRKSGEDRTNALIFRPWNDAYLVVASKGGDDAPPAWFLNIESDPAVTVQVKADRFEANARVATAEEKPALWKIMAEAWPAYDDYQRKTDREIPVVVLERTAGADA